METVLLLLLVMATYRPSGVTAAPIGAAGTVDPSIGPTVIGDPTSVLLSVLTVYT